MRLPEFSGQELPFLNPVVVRVVVKQVEPLHQGLATLTTSPNEYNGKSGAERGDRTRTVLCTTGF